MTVVNTKTIIGTSSRNLAVTGDASTDLISDFSPLYTNSILEIYLVPRGNSAVFTVQRKGDDTSTENLNNGNSCTAGNAYMFQIEANKTEDFNIQASAAQTDATIIITEVK